MVNAFGQVAGTSEVVGEESQHSFSWTAADGMVDIDGSEGRTSSPVAISDSGQVIGNSQAYSTCLDRFGCPPPQTAAFSWTPEGGTIDIGSLGGDRTSAVALNDSGQVVGSSSTAGNGPDHAYVWTAAGGMVDLGTLGGSFSHASDVSDSGQIVGYSSLAAGDSTYHAFSWTAAGGMVDLGSLGGSSYSFAVTEAGQVIGGYSTAENAGHVFSWTAAGGMVDIASGTAGDTSNDVRITAVSDSGQVIGHFFDQVAGTAPGYSWTSGGGMVTFDPESRPSGVNAAGVVVGRTHRAHEGDEQAFFWTAEGGMVNLGALDGALLTYAAAINNSNLVMGSSMSSSSTERTHFFTGRQVTTMVVALMTTIVLLPGAVWAVDAFSNVAIQDPVSGVKAKVDNSRRLAVGDGAGKLTVDGTVTARPAPPADFYSTYVSVAGSGDCDVLATPPSGKAAVLMA